MSAASAGAGALPEWVSLDFDDWQVIYHGGMLVGVGSPDYAGFQVSEYLGSTRYQENPALGTGGNVRLTAPFAPDGDYSGAWDKYTDSSAPEALDLAEFNQLQQG